MPPFKARRDWRKLSQMGPRSARDLDEVLSLGRQKGRERPRIGRETEKAAPHVRAEQGVRQETGRSGRTIERGRAFSLAPGERAIQHDQQSDALQGLIDRRRTLAGAANNIVLEVADPYEHRPPVPLPAVRATRSPRRESERGAGPRSRFENGTPIAPAGAVPLEQADAQTVTRRRREDEDEEDEALAADEEDEALQAASQEAADAFAAGDLARLISLAEAWGWWG